jgi:hypothetical protein
VFRILLKHQLELHRSISEMSNQGCCSGKGGALTTFGRNKEVVPHTFGTHFHLQLEAIDTVANGLEDHATTIVVVAS